MRTLVAGASSAVADVAAAAASVADVPSLRQSQDRIACSMHENSLDGASRDCVAVSPPLSRALETYRSSHRSTDP